MKAVAAFARIYKTSIENTEYITKTRNAYNDALVRLHGSDTAGLV